MTRTVNLTFFNSVGVWVTEEELTIETGLPADLNFAGMRQQIVNQQLAVPDGWTEGQWTVLVEDREEIDDLFPIVFPPGSFRGLRREYKYPTHDGYGVTSENPPEEAHTFSDASPYLETVIPTEDGPALLLKFRDLRLRFLDLENFFEELGITANILTAIQNAEADHGDLLIFPFFFPADDIFLASEDAISENVEYFYRIMRKNDGDEKEVGREVSGTWKFDCTYVTADGEVHPRFPGTEAPANEVAKDKAAGNDEYYIEKVIPTPMKRNLLIKFRGKPLQFLDHDTVPSSDVTWLLSSSHCIAGYASDGNLKIPATLTKYEEIYPAEYIWKFTVMASKENVEYFNQQTVEQEYITHVIPDDTRLILRTRDHGVYALWYKVLREYLLESEDSLVSRVTFLEAQAREGSLVIGFLTFPAGIILDLCTPMEEI